MFSYDVTAAILVFQNNKTAAMLVSKLNTLDNTDTETISAFVFFDCLVVSAHKTRVAMRFPAKITSSCIWVALPVG